MKSRGTSWKMSMLGYLACLAIVGISAFYSYEELQEMSMIMEKRSESRMRSQIMSKIMIAINDSETSQRGYLLTGEEPYLQPYSYAIQSLPVLQKKLAALSTDIPEWPAILDNFQILVSQKLREFEETIMTRKLKGIEAAMVIVRGGRGHQIMANIRVQLDSLQMQEEQRLNELTEEGNLKLRQVIMSITAGSLLAVLFMLGITFLIHREISLRKRTELELKEFFSSSLDMLCVTDTSGMFRRINPSFEHTLGYSIEDLKNKSLLDFMIAEDKPRTTKSLDIIVKESRAGAFEGRAMAKDGTVRHLSWRCSPVKNFIYVSASVMPGAQS